MMKRRIISDDSLYQKTVLKNGLRVVTEKLPSVRSITLGVWIDTGSRFETIEENGLSHFIEHMLFKGTRKRTARQIAAALESIGGSLNAFTSREQTCFIARILDEHLDVAIDVLSDMLCHSTLTPVNLSREKKVICEEIKESIDNPSDHIHDIFTETYWGKHPLGRPIMGSVENISGMPRSRIRDYIKRNYRAGSIVIAASGSVSHRKLVKLVKEYFDFPAGMAEPPQVASREKEKNIFFKNDDNNQTHICLGFPGIKYTDELKMSAMILNMYLGGGMSSVLFQKIREEKGLAYTIYTFLDFYRDSGIFGSYLSTNSAHLKQSIDITLAEMEKIKKRKLPESKLEQVKNQLKGNLMLGMESTSARMNRLGRQELMYSEYHKIENVLKEIDRVKARDILELANRIIDTSQLAIAVLGPAKINDLRHVI